MKNHKNQFIFSCLLFFLFSCQQETKLSDEDKNWIKKQIIQISDSISNERKIVSNTIDSDSAIENDQSITKNLSPRQIYDQFISDIKNNNLVKAQRYIHSDGVYFFQEGRFSKSTFANKIKHKVNSLLMKGRVSISDNFANAAGWDGDFQSPHLDMERWQERGGFFLSGSKIIVVDPNPELNQEKLLIELYPDKGEWRIFSIGMWYWSP